MQTAVKDAGGLPKGRSMPRQRKPLTRRRAQSLGEAGAFAMHLEGLLAERNLTPAKLAERCQDYDLPIEEWQVRAWLRGENMPRSQHLRPLAKVLGLEDRRHILPG